MRVEIENMLKPELINVEPTQARKPGIVPKMWSSEEDALLRNAIKQYGEKSWKQVAAEVPGRTYIQCLQRWKKALKPGLRKGHWSQQEDESLLQLVEEYKSNWDWALIAKFIPGRSAKQCRERWFLNLDPSINHGPWSAEEDHALMEFVRLNGGKWSLIAKYMEGRTENSVKTRYYSLQRKEARKKRWTDAEDTLIIETLLKHGRDFDVLDKALKHRTKGQLKKRFNTLIQRQPELLGQITLVEQSLRRKRKADDAQLEAPYQGRTPLPYTGSLDLLRENSDASMGAALQRQNSWLQGIVNSMEVPTKTHSMRKTISTTVLQDIIKPELNSSYSDLSLLNDVTTNTTSDDNLFYSKIAAKPREYKLRKANSLEVLQNLLTEFQNDASQFV